MVTMRLRSQQPLGQHSATLFSVAQPLLAVPQKPPDQHAATLHPEAILCDPFLGLAQVLDKNEAENEPEQFIENAWLKESKKGEPEQLIENKGSRFDQIFC
jgi:hypothetical protein